MPYRDFEDEVLGALKYDKRLDWMTGSTESEGRAIRLSLYLNDGFYEDALLRARQVIPNLHTHAAAAKDYAVAELLELKNDEWADEDEDGNPEKALTAEEFKARMKLTSIVFSAEGRVTFYHDDGDLFGGHCIEVRMNGADQFYHADIPG